nr:hypothetical protein [Alteribacter populi]
MGRMCPVCNGFTKIELQCEQCGKPLTDCGKYTDYFDKYSAYEEIDAVKLADGIKKDSAIGQCPHLLFCDSCHIERIVIIDERKIKTN